ncbi:MAG: hypothetical protein Q4C86_03235 [bacterium]|nr:hypothetical protein [bacterium]
MGAPKVAFSVTRPTTEAISSLLAVISVFDVVKFALYSNIDIFAGSESFGSLLPPKLNLIDPVLATTVPSPTMDDVPLIPVGAAANADADIINITHSTSAENTAFFKLFNISFLLANFSLTAPRYFPRRATAQLRPLPAS